jgi:hypothetical protein
MKNPLNMIDKETQKMLIGGLIGSLSYYGDLALSEQSFYPAALKGRVAPQLPRNDELLTSIAPPAIMYFIGKKKPKFKTMAEGTMLYSVPHLMQRIVVNVAKPASTTAAFAAFRISPIPVNGVAVVAANKIYPPAEPAQVVNTVESVGAGKYR